MDGQRISPSLGITGLCDLERRCASALAHNARDPRQRRVHGGFVLALARHLPAADAASSVNAAGRLRCGVWQSAHVAAGLNPSAVA